MSFERSITESSYQHIPIISRATIFLNTDNSRTTIENSSSNHIIHYFQRTPYFSRLIELLAEGNTSGAEKYLLWILQELPPNSNDIPHNLLTSFEKSTKLANLDSQLWIPSDCDFFNYKNDKYGEDLMLLHWECLVGFAIAIQHPLLLTWLLNPQIDNYNDPLSNRLIVAQQVISKGIPDNQLWSDIRHVVIFGGSDSSNSKIYRPLLFKLLISQSFRHQQLLQNRANIPFPFLLDTNPFFSYDHNMTLGQAAMDRDRFHAISIMVEIGKVDIVEMLKYLTGSDLDLIETVCNIIRQSSFYDDDIMCWYLLNLIKNATKIDFFEKFKDSVNNNSAATNVITDLFSHNAGKVLKLVTLRKDGSSGILTTPFDCKTHIHSQNHIFDCKTIMHVQSCDQNYPNDPVNNNNDHNLKCDNDLCPNNCTMIDIGGGFTYEFVDNLKSPPQWWYGGDTTNTTELWDIPQRLLTWETLPKLNQRFEIFFNFMWESSKFRDEYRITGSGSGFVSWFWRNGNAVNFLSKFLPSSSFPSSSSSLPTIQTNNSLQSETNSGIFPFPTPFSSPQQSTNMAKLIPRPFNSCDFIISILHTPTIHASALQFLLEQPLGNENGQDNCLIDVNKPLPLSFCVNLIPSIINPIELYNVNLPPNPTSLVPLTFILMENMYNDNLIKTLCNAPKYHRLNLATILCFDFQSKSENEEEEEEDLLFYLNEVETKAKNNKKTNPNNINIIHYSVIRDIYLQDTPQSQWLEPLETIINTYIDSILDHTVDEIHINNTITVSLTPPPCEPSVDETIQSIVDGLLTPVWFFFQAFADLFGLPNS